MCFEIEIWPCQLFYIQKEDVEKVFDPLALTMNLCIKFGKSFSNESLLKTAGES